MLMHRDPKALWLVTPPWDKFRPPQSGCPCAPAGLRHDDCR